MIDLSNKLKIGKLGIKCAEYAYRFYQGGNFWSGLGAFFSAFRDICKIDVDFSKWAHYEKLTIYGSWRFVHKEFCIISDRPRKLLVNSLNQPHCIDGPFCEWSDGTALYSLNGVRVPQWIVETKPEDFTREMILKEENADYRREIVRKLGMELITKLLRPKILDKEFGYELIGVDIGDNNVMPFLKMINPSINTVHIEGVVPETNTVKEAIVYRNGLNEFSLPKTLDGIELGLGDYHQQGDLLAFPIDLIPTDAKVKKDRVVLDGLRRHLTEQPWVKIYDGYVSSSEPFAISHPEHKDLILEAGNYSIKQVVEYDHWLEKSRKVID